VQAHQGRRAIDGEYDVGAMLVVGPMRRGARGGSVGELMGEWSEACDRQRAQQSERDRGERLNR